MFEKYSPCHGKFLIVKGSLVNAIDNKNATPLHYASYYGQTKITKILINN